MYPFIAVVDRSSLDQSSQRLDDKSLISQSNPTFFQDRKKVTNLKSVLVIQIKSKR